jgi:hypothetical protein
MKLANKHWEYVHSVLKIHGVAQDDIKLCGAAYRNGFIHGYHGLDSQAAEYKSLEEQFHYLSAFVHGEKHYAQDNKK